MTALEGQVVNASGFRPFLTGYHLDESLNFAGVVEVRSRIYSDYYSVTPTAPSNVFLSAIVVPFTFITAFDELVIKTFGGNPVRRKFGSITTLHENASGISHYVQTEAQTYSTYMSLVSPTPLPFPPDMSALPGFTSYNNILLSSLNTPSYPITNISPTVGISALAYDLEATVTANIGFYYLCYANYGLPAPSTLLISEV